MNEISVFNFQSSEVRVVKGDNGEPWFVAKDVCAYFGETNYRRAIQSCDEEEKGVSQITTPGGPQNMTIVNESGLYSLLFAMQPSKARGVSPEYIKERQQKIHAFKRWVTHEVLPSIRKHGAYVTDNKLEEWLTDPTHMIEALTALKEEREKVRALERKREEDRPKVVFAESVEVSQTSILVGEMAKLIKQSTGYDIGQNRFFEFLRDNGYLHCTGSQKNLPTQRSIASGWFEIKEGVHVSPNGVSILTRTPKITGKGQIYFINLFHKVAEEKAS